MGDVARLLADGADPNLRSPLGFTPLRSAVVVGDPGKVEVLLEAGALATETLPRDRWTLVMIAASDRDRAGQTEESDSAIAHMLVDGGADPCAQGTATGYEGMRASAIARTDGRPALAAELKAIEDSSCGGPT